MAKMKCIIHALHKTVHRTYTHISKYSEHLLSLQKHREIKGYYPTDVHWLQTQHNRQYYTTQLRRCMYGDCLFNKLHYSVLLLGLGGSMSCPTQCGHDPYANAHTHKHCDILLSLALKLINLRHANRGNNKS